jgi:hypothetical protein
MTKRRGGAFNSGNSGRPSPGHKGPKGERAGHKAGGTRTRRTEPLLEQPIADSVGAVPCQICGHPVDPKRLHFHMVRFHGAAFRPPRL